MTPEERSRRRWDAAPMDEAYLDRLKFGVDPDATGHNAGSMITETFRDEETGAVVIWRVNVRGDDLLELIRLARLGLTAPPPDPPDRKPGRWVWADNDTLATIASSALACWTGDPAAREHLLVAMGELLPGLRLPAASTVGGPWTAHGHAVDGVTVSGPGRPSVARCGGPGLCAECSIEAIQMTRRAGRG